MNRAKMGLLATAALVSVMLTFSGVCFLAGAAFFGLELYMSAWLAAVVVGLLLLTPLLALVAQLAWSARQRRVQAQQRHSLEGLKAIFAERAQQDPYGFVGAAFSAGLGLAAKREDSRGIVELIVSFGRQPQV
jgi:hypothetical protein